MSTLIQTTFASIQKASRATQLLVVLVIFLIMTFMFVDILVNRISSFHTWSETDSLYSRSGSNTLFQHSKGEHLSSSWCHGPSPNTNTKTFTYWTGMDRQYSQYELSNFTNLLKPDVAHEQVFGTKVMTCFGQQHALTCGLTNQLFELITCMALSVKVGAKKFILPSICTDGNWGLCYCSKSDRYSKLFDMERLKKVAMERFGMSVMEYEESAELLKDSSEELFAHLDQTETQKPLAHAADIIHKKALEKPNCLNHQVLNLGYVWGRWRGLSVEEDMLYVLFFDLFVPSNISRKIMYDWKFKTEADSTGPLIAIHNQIHTAKQHPDVYPGCQRTTNTDFFSVYLNEFQFKDKDYRILMTGAGFELQSADGLKLSELSTNHKIHVYPQFDIMRTTANHQFHNSLYAFWLSVEADYFIATTCESQFLSHIFAIRKLLGKPSCSVADISKTYYPDSYPEKYLHNANGEVAYRFPHPYRGTFYTVEKCKFPLAL